MREVEPKDTKRASAYVEWMHAPMPMSTIFTTIDVTNLSKICKGPVYDFDIMLSYCIGKAASQVEEFYMLPTEASMAVYEQLGVRTAVMTSEGYVCVCDIPFSWELKQFQQDYMTLTKLVHDTAGPRYLTNDAMIVGTISLPDVQVDGVVAGYDGRTFNPIVTWGRPKKRFFKKMTLGVTLQYHQAQMDGIHAATFLQNLEREVRTFKPF